jgi:hypothetical protein
MNIPTRWPLKSLRIRPLFLMERFYQFWTSFFDNGKEKAPVSCSLIGALVIPLAM